MHGWTRCSCKTHNIPEVTLFEKNWIEFRMNNESFLKAWLYYVNLLYLEVSCKFCLKTRWTEEEVRNTVLFSFFLSLVLLSSLVLLNTEIKKSLEKHEVVNIKLCLKVSGVSRHFRLKCSLLFLTFLFFFQLLLLEFLSHLPYPCLYQSWTRRIMRIEMRYWKRRRHHEQSWRQANEWVQKKKEKWQKQITGKGASDASFLH